MELRLIFEGEQAGRKLKQNMDKAGQMVRDGMREAAKAAADEILFRGAEDIESAGNFGDRWQEALHADIDETQRTIRVIVSMQGGPPVQYWRVFEYGAHIEAKNPSGLMWLPFPGTTGENREVWPSAYSGKLFSNVTEFGTATTRSGKRPTLFDADTKEPQYFGMESVDIPQKFHLRQIIAEVSRELRAYYREHMSNA